LKENVAQRLREEIFAARISSGSPHLAEQTLIHVTNSFLHSALEVWAQ